LYPTTSSEVDGAQDNSTPLVNAFAVIDGGALGAGLVTVIAEVHVLDTPEELIARTRIAMLDLAIPKMDLLSS
jgi:acetylglutamate synthase